MRPHVRLRDAWKAYSVRVILPTLYFSGASGRRVPSKADLLGFRLIA